MFKTFAAATLSLVLVLPASAPAALPKATEAAIDAQAKAVLAKTGVPSASIAVVKDGKIAYLKAYGAARLEPRIAATPSTRYAIGSISKQFTATAILMLAEEGKLSLDDPVGKYVPRLTDGDRITVRQVLDMTAGYRDFWPQDYVPAEMNRPASPDHIFDKWARVPLDYAPGSDWQYSNTGYIIAAMVIEKAAGEPLMAYLDRKIFRPLAMTSVYDFDAAALKAPDAGGYMRYALGPIHPAVKEGRGWLYGMGELAMTAEDLARWDVAMIGRRLMQPASYDAQQTDTPLTDGRTAGYGLGVFVGTGAGRPMISHGGAMSGYLAENRVYPDDGTAIVVLTNADFGSAQTAIADRIQAILFPGGDETARARAIFEGLRKGRIDRQGFTANGSAYFTDQAVADFAASLGLLGEPESFTRTSKRMRGGFTSEVYAIAYADGRKLKLVMRARPDGKVEQYMISRVD
jgi:CubicO group peptidase (beta-lactamase class C family)